MTTIVISDSPHHRMIPTEDEATQLKIQLDMHISKAHTWTVEWSHRQYLLTHPSKHYHFLLYCVLMTVSWETHATSTFLCDRYRYASIDRKLGERKIDIWQLQVCFERLVVEICVCVSVCARESVLSGQTNAFARNDSKLLWKNNCISIWWPFRSFKYCKMSRKRCHSTK